MLQQWTAGDEITAAKLILTGVGYGSSSAGSDAYAITFSPAIASYVDGMEITFTVDVGNTGSATLNVNGIGAKTIKKYDSRNLETGDLTAGGKYKVVYDSTDDVFKLISPTNKEMITGFFFEIMFNSASGASSLGSCGFSDATTDLIAVGVLQNSTDIAYTARMGVSEDIGMSVYLLDKTSSSLDSTSSASTTHPLYIGSDVWIDDATTLTIDKNGSAVTISGTARHGPLGHDATNSYLLILYSTTKIARFSGIAGTTITNTNSDITLDTAVSQVGFVYDDLNDQYICVDRTNNLLRKFNSSGTTVETVTYTVDDSNVIGVTLINNRYFLVMFSATSFSGINPTSLSVSYVPTNMIRG